MKESPPVPIDHNSPLRDQIEKHLGYKLTSILDATFRAQAKPIAQESMESEDRPSHKFVKDAIHRGPGITLKPKPGYETGWIGGE